MDVEQIIPHCLTLMGGGGRDQCKFVIPDLIRNPVFEIGFNSIAGMFKENQK